METGLGVDRGQVDVDRARSTLSGLLRAREIDQNFAHQAREPGEEVRPAGPIHRRPVHQTDKCFVDQGRRLQQVPLPFPREIVAGEAMELGINERRETVERGAIPCHSKP